MSTKQQPKPFTLDPAEHGLPVVLVGGEDQPDGGYCRQTRDLSTGEPTGLTLHTGTCTLLDASESTPVDVASGCTAPGLDGPTLLVSGYYAGWTFDDADDGLYTSPTGWRQYTRGRGFDCCDCGVNTIDANESDYFLHNETWRTVMAAAPPAKPNPHGTEMLCIGCAETRLGRPLAPEDFKPVPLTTMDAERSERLKDRMGLA